MKKKDNLYYPTLGEYLLTGIWVQNEFDNNGNGKQNELGIDWKYDFNRSGEISLNISIIDTWIPLKEFCVDNSGTKISFHEGDISETVFMELLENMNDHCVKIAKYKRSGENTTFDDYYQLCKIQ